MHTPPPTNRSCSFHRTAADEKEIVKAGAAAASIVNNALGGLALGANPWASVATNLVPTKPHKAGDKGYQALLQLQVRGWVGC